MDVTQSGRRLVYEALDLLEKLAADQHRQAPRCRNATAAVQLVSDTVERGDNARQLVELFRDTSLLAGLMRDTDAGVQVTARIDLVVALEGRLRREIGRSYDEGLGEAENLRRTAATARVNGALMNIAEGFTKLGDEYEAIQELFGEDAPANAVVLTGLILSPACSSEGLEMFTRMLMAEGVATRAIAEVPGGEHILTAMLGDVAHGVAMNAGADRTALGMINAVNTYAALDLGAEPQSGFPFH